MSGNTENARLWAYADVYVAERGAELPASADDPFPSDWTPVGLLNGEDGFNESREEEKGNHFGWGSILIRTSRRNFVLTKKFSVLEDNPTTRRLIWPRSPEGKIVVPRPESLLIGFETRDELGAVRRLITENRAEVDVDGDINENESDLTKVELVAMIFPTADGVLFDEQKSDNTDAPAGV